LLTITLVTDNGDRMSLFAARAETSAGSLPTIERRAGAGIAYWEKGPFAYALSVSWKRRISCDTQPGSARCSEASTAPTRPARGFDTPLQLLMV